jgi:spoIIIJ-associated protein
MQWVETTGRTIEDAKEAALDQLGIDESEAEFEILEEPKTGLFGRVRSEARVRARIVPKSPRPKQERRPRKGRTRSEGTGGSATAADAPGPTDGVDQPPTREAGTPDAAGSDVDATAVEATPRPNRSRSRSRAGRDRSAAPTTEEGNQMNDEIVPVGEQADIITTFIEGLLDALGIEASINRTQVDDETIELDVVSDSSDLGLLIGPKGQTLSSVHELARAVLQRRAPGHHEGRVRIDIGGYRHRRREALARFVQQQATAVIESGVSRALEPMNAVDRKVVHDTVNEMDGVSTISEGLDPDRRVVIVPDHAAG